MKTSQNLCFHLLFLCRVCGHHSSNVLQNQHKHLHFLRWHSISISADTGERQSQHDVHMVERLHTFMISSALLEMVQKERGRLSTELVWCLDSLKPSSFPKTMVLQMKESSISVFLPHVFRSRKVRYLCSLISCQ